MPKVEELKEKMAGIIDDMETEEETSEDTAEKLAEMTLQKIAEKTQETDGADASEEVAPRDMIDEGQALTTEEKKQIIEALKELDQEKVEQELTERQRNKVAAVRGQFEKQGKSAKGELFEKVASNVLLNNPRIVLDHNFQKYESLEGEEMQFPLHQEGEIVNPFPQC